MALTIRGKVVKVPDATPGLLFVNGQQKPFQIDGVWQSLTIAPAANMTVDIDLNESGTILAVRPVSDTQIAEEKARLALDVASVKGKALASLMLEKVGKPTLVATGLLMIGWFFLDLFSFKVPLFEIKLSFTYWQMIGWLNYIQSAVGNPLQLLAQGGKTDVSQGFYGFVAIAALLGPLLPAVWKDKRAMLGAVAPLLFTLLFAIQCGRLVSSARDAISGNSANNDSPYMSLQQKEVMKEAEEAQEKQAYKELNFQLGLGFYLSTAATLYLAATGIRKYLVLKAIPSGLGTPAYFTTPQPVAPRVSVPAPAPLEPAVMTQSAAVTHVTKSVSATSVCSKCETPLEPNSKFCAECGEPQA